MTQLSKEQIAEIEDRHSRHAEIVARVANDENIDEPAAIAMHWLNLDRAALLAHIAAQSPCNGWRDEVADWMISKGIATGHGDTLNDLLTELVLHCSDYARTVTANRYGEASEQWQAGFECGGNAAANRVREIIHLPQANAALPNPPAQGEK